jgi:GT2 family glycosyltransferase
VTGPGNPAVSAVILAWGDEPYLVEAVEAVLASERVQVEVLLVDNGCTNGAVDAVAARGGVTVLRPGRNTGFAGGCNLGAARAAGEYVAFVNSDAVVRPDALAHLVTAASDPSVGLASASLRLHDRPEVVNSVGNPVHFSGLSWAGGLGEPADEHRRGGDITSVTGAAMVARRTVYEALGGFNELMFAYCEDAELSLRTWQRGLRCVYVPESVVLHHYEFSRNPQKFYLLERNRLILLLTLYEKRTLLMLAPPLLALELAMLAVSLRHGWASAKVRGWWWLLRHRREVAAARRSAQSARSRSDADLAGLLTGDVAPGEGAGFSAPSPLRRASRVYWAAARRLL